MTISLLLSTSTCCVALTLGGVCSLPADPGPCLAYIPRYFYNSTSMKCERFIYGGCLGNANNYERREDCQACCGELYCIRDNLNAILD